MKLEKLEKLLDHGLPLTNAATVLADNIFTLLYLENPSEERNPITKYFMSQLGFGLGLSANVLFNLSLYLCYYHLVNKIFDGVMEGIAKKLDERSYKGTAKFPGQEFIKKYPIVKKFLGYPLLAVLSYKHIRYGALSWLNKK